MTTMEKSLIQNETCHADCCELSVAEESQENPALPSAALLIRSAGHVHHGNVHNENITDVYYNVTEGSTSTFLPEPGASNFLVQADIHGSFHQKSEGRGDIVNAANYQKTVNINNPEPLEGQQRMHPEFPNKITQNSADSRNVVGKKKCGGNNNQNSEDNCCYHKKRGCLARKWSDATSALKRKLKNSYKNATLPRVAWMDEGKNLKLKDYYAKLKLDSTGQNVTLDTIFDKNTTLEVEDIDDDNGVFGRLGSLLKPSKSKEELPKRILIEGQHGFGKTTLSSKLAFDWAVGAEYMKKFNLVFILPLRKVTSDTVTTALAKEAQKCKFNDADKVQDAICSNGSKVLIILDGFDELPSGKFRDNVLRVLYGLNYSDATVAVTCRSGMFRVDHKQLYELRTAVEEQKEFWDEKVNVLGVDVDGMKKLLTEFLSANEAREMIEKLNNLDEPFREIFKCPLVLSLIGFLYQKGQIVQFETTKTKLYKAILNGLAKYNIARQNLPVDENIDLFDFSREDISQFGNICLENLEKSKYQFEDTDLTQKMYETGFLSKLELPQKEFVTSFQFESIHRSIIEFFAAFYICEQFETSENKQLSKQTIETLHKIFFETRGTSLVLPFLVGMLESDVHLLFDQLSSNAQLYSKNQGGLWRMLEECQETDETVKSLVPFIPPEINSSEEKELSAFAATDFFEHLILEENRQSKLEVLILHSSDDYIYKCPPNVHFEKIDICLYPQFIDDEILNKNSLLLGQVSCSSLTLIFIGKFENSENNRNIMTDWLKLLENSNAENINLRIYESITCDLLFSCVRDDILREKPIHYLQCELNDNNSDWLELIVFLMKRNQLRGLGLLVKDKHCFMKMEEVLNCAVKSTLLTSFFIRDSTNDDNKQVIDLDRLTDDGMKSWNFVGIYGIKMKSTTSGKNKFQVNQLMYLPTDDSTTDILLNSHVSTLQCTYSFLINLQEISEFFKYTIFTSLTELNLWLGDKLSEPIFWTNLMNFRNLEKFMIYFLTETSVPHNVTDCLQSMKIHHLEISCLNSCINATVQFIRQLEKSFPWTMNGAHHPLSQIDVYFLDKPNSPTRDLIIPLLGCVGKGKIKRVGIIWNKGEDFRSESCDWVDRNKFRMDHSIAGMEERDMEESKYWYNIGVYYQKVTIQLRQSNENVKKVEELKTAAQ